MAIPSLASAVLSSARRPSARLVVLLALGTFGCTELFARPPYGQTTQTDQPDPEIHLSEQLLSEGLARPVAPFGAQPESSLLWSGESPTRDTATRDQAAGVYGVYGSKALASPALIYKERAPGVVLVASQDRFGTGVVVSLRGDIVTNAHLLDNAHRAKGQDWLAVWFKPEKEARIDKNSFYLARVIKSDRMRDVGLVRVTRGLPSHVTIVPLASALPEVGQDVFVIGHPSTYLWSFIRGTVSQVQPGHRWVTADKVTRLATTIQAQGFLSPGHSGGPLLDQNGAMTGLVAASPTDAPGMFFAVAAEHVRTLLSESSASQR